MNKEIKVNGRVYHVEPHFADEFEETVCNIQGALGFRNLFLLPGRFGYFEHFEVFGPVATIPEPGDILIEVGSKAVATGVEDGFKRVYESTGKWSWTITQHENGVVDRQNPHLLRSEY